MRFKMATASAGCALAAMLATPAAAGVVQFAGSGVFGPTISLMDPVEIPGEAFSFSFDLPSVVASDPATGVTHSHFVVAGNTVADDITSVTFYPVGLGGGFDLNFFGGQVISLYLTDPVSGHFADVGSNLTIVTGHYNFTLDSPSAVAGSGTVNLTAVPEPASWGLMVLGFGGLGAALRASRRRAFASA